MNFFKVYKFILKGSTWTMTVSQNNPKIPSITVMKNSSERMDS